MRFTRPAPGGAWILILVLGMLAGCGGTPQGDATRSGPAPATTAVPPGPDFPAEVDGMPVISVARADELRRSGALDGRAVAVAGWFNTFTAGCPAILEYVGPLEGACRFVAFTDTRAGAELCHPEGANGASCSMPSGVNLDPYLMSETSGNDQTWGTGGIAADPLALVLVGHAGDPRQWQCTADTQATCAGAFVVDRVAWAQGSAVPVTVPQTGESLSGRPVTPTMTLEEVDGALGTDEPLLAAAAFLAGDIATIDPRWNLAGDDIVWFARTQGAADATAAPETRAVTTWLVDDATGRVIDQRPLAPAADFEPGRLWRMATVHGEACCAGDVFPFTRVTSADGTVVYEGMVPGSSWGDEGSTIYGGGYGSWPLILPAGTYTVDAWRALYARGQTGAPIGGCSGEVTLEPLSDTRFNAEFPDGQACTIGPAPSPSPTG